MIDPYAILTRDGKKVDALTDGALRRAEKRLGYSLSVTQGSYNNGAVAASGPTHDGGGVVDLMPWDWENKVAALRGVGFAAWYRPAIPGLWPSHIHAALIGHGRLDPSAARQVSAYLARRNGLVSNLPDTDPGWTNTARYTVEAFKADVIRAALTEKIAGAKAERLTLTARIKRWREKRAGLSK